MHVYIGKMTANDVKKWVNVHVNNDLSRKLHFKPNMVKFKQLGV